MATDIYVTKYIDNLKKNMQNIFFGTNNIVQICICMSVTNISYYNNKMKMKELICKHTFNILKAFDNRFIMFLHHFTKHGDIFEYGVPEVWDALYIGIHGWSRNNKLVKTYSHKLITFLNKIT